MNEMYKLKNYMVLFLEDKLQLQRRVPQISKDVRLLHILPVSLACGISSE